MPTWQGCPVDPTHTITGRYYQPALRQHMEQYHPGYGTFKCPIDGQTFNTQAELDAHTASAHPTTNPADPRQPIPRIPSTGDGAGAGTGYTLTPRYEYTTATGQKYRSVDMLSQWGGGGWGLQKWDATQNRWIDIFTQPFTGNYGIRSFEDFVQQAGLSQYGNAQQGQPDSWWRNLETQLAAWGQEQQGNLGTPAQPPTETVEGQGGVREIYQTREGDWYRTVNVPAGPENIGGWGFQKWDPNTGQWTQIAGESFYANPTYGRFGNFEDFAQAMGGPANLTTNQDVQNFLNKLKELQYRRLVGQYNVTRGKNLYGPGGEQIQDPYLLQLLQQQYALQHDRPWNLSDQGMPSFQPATQTWDEYTAQLQQWMNDPARYAWQTSGQYAQDAQGNWYSLAYRDISQQIMDYMAQQGITYGQPTPPPTTPPTTEPPPTTPAYTPPNNWYEDTDPNTIDYNPNVGQQPYQGSQPQPPTNNVGRNAAQFSAMPSTYQPQQSGALGQTSSFGGNNNMPTASTGMRTNTGQNAMGGGLSGTAPGSNLVPDLAGMLGGGLGTTAQGLGGIDQKAIPAVTSLLIMKEIGALNAKVDQMTNVRTVLPAIMSLFGAGGEGNLPNIATKSLGTVGGPPPPPGGITNRITPPPTLPPPFVLGGGGGGGPVPATGYMPPTTTPPITVEQRRGFIPRRGLYPQPNPMRDMGGWPLINRRG